MDICRIHNKMTATQKEVDLESLVTKEELERHKAIRVEKIPTEVRQIGEGTVLLYKFDNGSVQAGKKITASSFNKSSAEESELKKVNNL